MQSLHSFSGKLSQNCKAISIVFSAECNEGTLIAQLALQGLNRSHCSFWTGRPCAPRLPVSPPHPWQQTRSRKAA